MPFVLCGGDVMRRRGGCCVKCGRRITTGNFELFNPSTFHVDRVCGACWWGTGGYKRRLKPFKWF